MQKYDRIILFSWFGLVMAYHSIQLVFQPCRGGATITCVLTSAIGNLGLAFKEQFLSINQYYWCIAFKEHCAAEEGIEPKASHSGVLYSTSTTAIPNVTM